MLGEHGRIYSESVNHRLQTARPAAAAGGQLAGVGHAMFGTNVRALELLAVLRIHRLCSTLDRFERNAPEFRRLLDEWILSRQIMRHHAVANALVRDGAR